MQIKCFDPTLWVKFTLLEKWLCFGGHFKGKWAWMCKVYFLHVQKLFKLPGSTCCWSLPASWWAPRQSLSQACVTWNPHALANALIPGEAWAFGGWNAQSLLWDVLLRNSGHNVNLAVDCAIPPLFFYPPLLLFISPGCDMFHNDMFHLMLLLSNCTCENTASQKRFTNMGVVTDGTLFVKEKAYVCLVVCGSKSSEKWTDYISNRHVIYPFPSPPPLK